MTITTLLACGTCGGILEQSLGMGATIALAFSFGWYKIAGWIHRFTQPGGHSRD